jgi:uncharacterized protein YecE (DUF72 family)
MRAAERMAYYAERLSLVELESTYRFPPTPDLARQLVERTPSGFTIDVHAWALLCGNATLPDSLWDDLRGEIRPDLRDRRRLYHQHLSQAGRREAWARFQHALEPLRQAGRLGAVILRYPHWLKPGETGRSLMLEARRMLPGLELAVELRNPEWLDGGSCEATLAFLEDHGLGFVCVDAFHARPVAATTTDLAVVRLHGHNPGDWHDPDLDPAARFAYRYSQDELTALVARVHQLAAVTDEVHVLFANTYRDFAVTNATELVALLASEGVTCS